eukprot:scaffold129331_cov30-Phaeocystis_antarctica.AAC.1
MPSRMKRLRAKWSSRVKAEYEIPTLSTMSRPLLPKHEIGSRSGHMKPRSLQPGSVAGSHSTAPA